MKFTILEEEVNHLVHTDATTGAKLYDHTVSVCSAYYALNKLIDFF